MNGTSCIILDVMYYGNEGVIHLGYNTGIYIMA